MSADTSLATTAGETSHIEDVTATVTCETARADDVTNRAEAFLSRVVPWPSANLSGYVNLHYSMDNPREPGKKIVTGKPFTALDGFMKFVGWVQQQPSMKDMWFCTSLQSTAGKTSRNKAKAIRRHLNAVGLKAIWIDIDVKEGQYDTLEAAMKAFAKFRVHANLPPVSALVQSGSGLHAYWISDRLLIPAVWSAYAHGLRALIFKHGLKCDAGLTTDNVRLLRVPGTFNYKTTPPKPVQVLKLLPSDYDFAATPELRALTTLAPAQNASQGSLPVANQMFDPALFTKPDPAFAALAPEALMKRDKVAPLPVIKGCKFLRDALLTGGKDFDNPRWNLTTLISVFLEDGNALAHKMAAGHKDYTHESTEALYHRKERDQRTKNLGYPKCATIQAAGCGDCAACPFFQHGKSPLNLTPEITATVTNTLPSAASTSAPAIWRQNELKVAFSGIPHRRWLYGFDLVRGELTVIASPGGVGKSSLAIGMATSIATGRELLGEKIRGNDLNVLLINAEDSSTEIRRRVWALSLAYNIAEQNLRRLSVAGADDPKVQRLSFLKTNEKNSSVLDHIGFDVLESAFQQLRPDVVILDPLVALCAGGNMNDNAAMSLVMRQLKRLAAQYNCAVLIVHHTRKGGDVGSAESISGASATVNLARHAIMPVPMTVDEATKFGVLPSERFRYFKLVDAKSNLAPRSADSPWYQLCSVELPNPEPPIYPLGDGIQVVVRANLSPSSGAPNADVQKIHRTILDLVERGKMIDGQPYPYSPSAAGADNERALLDDAMSAARSATAPRQWLLDDLKSIVNGAIKKMKTDGWLISRDMKELMPGPNRFRRGQGLKVNRACTPWPTASDRDVIAEDNAPDIDGGQLVNSLVN